MEVRQSSGGPTHEHLVKFLIDQSNTRQPNGNNSSEITDDHEKNNSTIYGGNTLKSQDTLETINEDQSFTEDGHRGKQSYEKNKLRINFDPFRLKLRTWNKIFVVTWVISVSTDPLLLYIPTINDDQKCVSMDQNLKIIAFLLRSVTDIFHFSHIIVRIRRTFKDKESEVLPQQNGVAHKNINALARRNIRWSANILVEILAVLPLPQVIILVFFSRAWGWRSLTTTKYLNMAIFLQYVPRVLQIYLSCEELKRAPGTFRRIMWFNGGLNFLLYVIASHVFGALWYFFSIQQETACWKNACENHDIGCVASDFDCHSITLKNMTFLNDFCPINPPNPSVFDYGIFLDAVQSGILRQMSFPEKFARCFWWGLRNLSSFGQNLQTSTNVWETCFAVLISISALILFLYLIGNVQRYIQMATTRSEEIRQKMKMLEPDIDFCVKSHKLLEDKKTLIAKHVKRALKHDKDNNVGLFSTTLMKSLFSDEKDHSTKGNPINDEIKIDLMKLERRLTSEEKAKMRNIIKERDAQLWISKNEITDRDIKDTIMQYVGHRWPDNQDVNLETLHSMLPLEHKKALKNHLCDATLKKMLLLQDISDGMVRVRDISEHLKPVIYPENHYIIREGEPLDFMLFITQGVVLTFKTGTNSLTKCLEKGHYYGEELLKWKSGSYSDLPISITSAKTHTKVEALALMATDLKQIRSTAAATIQKAIRRHNSTKQEKPLKETQRVTE